MIDVDKIQIGDTVVSSDIACYPKGTKHKVVEEGTLGEYWVNENSVEISELKGIEECFTLAATNTKYSDITEGDIVEIACLSDEQLEKWITSQYLIGLQGEVIHKSKSIHVEIDGEEWCLQPENLRVVTKATKESVLTSFSESQPVAQYTGGSSDYYKVFVKNPTTLLAPYEAECNDIIEALNMTFAEGNAFKAIWRKAKARQGVKKKGYDNGVYDSEKVVFFGERMLIEAKDNESI